MLTLPDTLSLKLCREAVISSSKLNVADVDEASGDAVTAIH
jgi:hypothetical protein